MAVSLSALRNEPWRYGGVAVHEDIRYKVEITEGLMANLIAESGGPAL
jgi:hypothetical protein